MKSIGNGALVFIVAFAHGCSHGPHNGEAPFSRRTPSACVFQGDRMHVLLYATETGGRADFSVYGAKVEALRPAASAEGRLPIRLAYPILAEGWIEADSLPFRLRQRQDKVPGHVWLSVGTRVTAHNEKDGSVVVVRPGGRKGDVHSSPDGYRARLSCNRLTVSDDAAAEPEAKGGEVGFVHGKLRISHAPGGIPLLAIPPSRSQEAGPLEVVVLDRQGDWTRVRMKASDGVDVFDFERYVPFDFDGWTKDPVLADSGRGGLIGNEIFPPPPTHVVSRPLALRTEPERSAAVPAHLAVGVPLNLGRQSGEFTAVEARDVEAAAEGKVLWVLTSELEAGTTTKHQ